MIGIIVFFVIYWVFPLIFQIGSVPLELELQSGEEDNIGLGIGYIITHFFSLISLFAYYPLVTLPFIFFVAPFISILITWNRLRKEKGSMKDTLDGVTFAITDSPFKVVRDEVMRNDWTREKQILKLMIVLLPISLFLLQVILKVTEITNLQSSLGWFLEILFVYLAMFIFSIELMLSSKIALRGRFFGETIRNQTYKSLYIVGVPISILAIILFIVESTESLGIIIYFFAYFIMSTVIFILFLKIFEPISIIIFIKIINWWRSRKQEKQRRKQIAAKQEEIKKRESRSKNFYIGIFFGFAAVGIFIVVFLLFGFAYGVLFPNPQVIIDSAKYDTTDPVYLSQSLAFDLMNIFTFFTLVIIPLLISIAALWYVLKFSKGVFVSYASFMPVVIILSALLQFGFGMNTLINFTPSELWLTGQASYTNIFGFTFYTMRTAGFDANLTGVLGILAIPYLATQYIFNIIIWSLIVYYLRKSFKAKNVSLDEKHVEKIVFSTIPDFINYKEYSESSLPFLITKNEEIDVQQLPDEREEIKTLLKTLEKEALLTELKPADDSEKKRFYFTLKYLFNNEYIDVSIPEFSYIFEIVEKQGLYVIYGDGRDVFDYQFSEDVLHDPALISGMFTAITSFVKETTKSEDLLKSIDHGDTTILLEYGKYIFTALFIKGNETSDIRARLKEFIEIFESKYANILEDWSGALIHFKGEHKLVEEIFKEE